MSLLDQVTLARARRDHATEALRAAAQTARDAGETVTAIAAAAGVTRQTVYGWLGERPASRADARDVIRDYLTEVAGMLEAADQPRQAQQLRNRAASQSSDIALQTGLKMARTWVAPAAHGFDEDYLLKASAANQAEERLRKTSTLRKESAEE